MSANTQTDTYFVRATDPTNNEQVAFQCVGWAMTHAKAAELRMAGYRDVITSIARPDDHDRGPSAAG